MKFTQNQITYNPLYIIINPFSSRASHGIANYYVNLTSFLEKENIPFFILNNDSNLPPEKFREHVKNYIESHYGFDDVFIEAPEVKASTLLLDPRYKVHIRLHTAGFIAQEKDNQPVNQQLKKDELYVINTSYRVSSPSYGLIKELEKYVIRKDISVYKNPLPIEIISNLEKIKKQREAKEYDVVFMARFQILKGIEYLNNILEKLPEEFNVLLFGSGSDKFILSKKIKCSVTIKPHIESEYKFELLSQSKNLLQLSKFENCSMVILEGLSCGNIIHCWDVGGNKEIASSDILKISPFGDVDYLVEQLLDNSKYINKGIFESSLKEIQTDFINGFKHMCLHYNDDLFIPFKGINKQQEWKEDVKYKNYTENDKSIAHKYDNFGQRILGFSISNEHIEELWMPIIQKMNSDYLFISKRPIGFMEKFGNRFYVDPDKYLQFDWIKYPNLLIEQIKNYKPHKILFHNGLHPSYQHVLARVKKAFPNIPIVYSELGWFPQQDHCYFDEKGVNSHSYIAEQNFEEFTGCKLQEPDKSEFVKKEGSIVILTQLENDTNLLIGSKRFKNMLQFLKYILSQIPNEKNIIIKTHPLDKQADRFNILESKNVSIIKDMPLSDLYPKAKAVIGINSTGLLEALNYNCNVYFFGEGVLNNKSVAIDCRDQKIQLKDVWQNTLYSTQSNKEKVILGFKDRQIKLSELSDKTISECLSLKSFSPLTRRVAKYKNGDEFLFNKNNLQQGVKKTNTVANSIKVNKKVDKANIEQTSKPTNEYLESKGVSRKFKKLQKNPKQFFIDSKNPLLKKLIKLFK